ncbi:MAG: tol-pal system-associated acyl-CoA thioesterase [Paracoccus sp. (in: a-proteobacteria)]|nr:tol-pal system-associated acyl-CoA thioesterase [Paracoccus sp. (in: a-proteobacteria)]
MHHLPVRVYYEDTDLAGIVYYANYLKFIERGRTEWVRELGIDQNRLKDEQGLVFAVRRVEADYLAPARFDDLLRVNTAPAQIGNARIEVAQTVTRDDRLLFQARVTMVCVSTATMRAARVPADLAALMQS